MQRLSLAILWKAEGSFLWVKLALNSVLRSLLNEDDTEILHARLDLLPGDLSDLYAHMWKRTNDDHKLYREQATEIFSFHEFLPCDLTLMAFAYDTSLQRLWYQCSGALDNASILQSCYRLSKLINVGTAGLLESRTEPMHELHNLARFLKQYKAESNTEGQRPVSLDTVSFEAEFVHVSLSLVSHPDSVTIFGTDLKNPSQNMSGTASPVHTLGGRPVVRKLIDRVDFVHRSAYDFLKTRELGYEVLGSPRTTRAERLANMLIAIFMRYVAMSAYASKTHRSGALEEIKELAYRLDELMGEPFSALRDLKETENDYALMRLESFMCQWPALREGSNEAVVDDRTGISCYIVPLVVLANVRFSPQYKSSSYLKRFWKSFCGRSSDQFIAYTIAAMFVRSKPYEAVHSFLSALTSRYRPSPKIWEEVWMPGGLSGVYYPLEAYSSIAHALLYRRLYGDCFGNNLPESYAAVAESLVALGIVNTGCLQQQVLLWLVVEKESLNLFDQCKFSVVKYLDDTYYLVVLETSLYDVLSFLPEQDRKLLGVDQNNDLLVEQHRRIKEIVQVKTEWTRRGSVKRTATDIDMSGTNASSLLCHINTALSMWKICAARVEAGAGDLDSTGHSSFKVLVEKQEGCIESCLALFETLSTYPTLSASTLNSYGSNLFRDAFMSRAETIGLARKVPPVREDDRYNWFTREMYEERKKYVDDFLANSEFSTKQQSTMPANTEPAPRSQVSLKSNPSEVPASKDIIHHAESPPTPSGTTISMLLSYLRAFGRATITMASSFVSGATRTQLCSAIAAVVLLVSIMVRFMLGYTRGPFENGMDGDIVNHQGGDLALSV